MIHVINSWMLKRLQRLLSWEDTGHDLSAKEVDALIAENTGQEQFHSR